MPREVEPGRKPNLHSDAKHAAVKMFQQGATRKEVAKAFGVTTRTVSNWRRRLETFESDGDPLARKKSVKSSKSRLSQKEQLKLLQWVEAKPDITNDEIARRLSYKIRPKSVSRYIKLLGITRKRVRVGDKPLTTTQQLEIPPFVRRSSRIQLESRVYEDESALFANEYPRYGRRVRGKPVSVPLERNAKRFTMYWAIRRSGQVHSPIVLAESANDANFSKYVLGRLARHLRRGESVFWDRLGRSGRSRNPVKIHYNPTLRQRLQAKGVKLFILPPKGKYFNPIEEAIGVLKGRIRHRYLRSAAYREQRDWTLAELQKVAKEEAAKIPPSAFRGFFKHRAGTRAFAHAYPVVYNDLFGSGSNRSNDV